MNYLGSSLFIINLDFNYQYENEAQNEFNFENPIKKGKDKIKRQNHDSDNISNNQSELPLPPIK